MRVRLEQWNTIDGRLGTGLSYRNEWIEKLKAGDDVIVETKDYWFVYTLKLDRIVSPSALGVVSNAPLSELHTAPNDPYQVITLITCEPRWSTEKRWVWWGTLSAVYPRETPPLVIKVLEKNL